MRMAEVDVVINNRYMFLKPCKTEYYYEIDNGETYYRLVRNIPFDLNMDRITVSVELPFELEGYEFKQLYFEINNGRYTNMTYNGAIGKFENGVLNIIIDRVKNLKNHITEEETVGVIVLTKDDKEEEIKFNFVKK